MAFIRGDSLLALKLSAPHAGAVYNETEELIEKLEKFNAWVDEFNAANLAPILKQTHCHWFGFSKFRREFMLSYDFVALNWRLDGVLRRNNDGDGGCGPDGPPDAPPPDGGNSLVRIELNGGFHLAEPERPARRRPPRRRRGPPAGKGAKPAPAQPAAAVAKRAAEKLQWRTRALLRAVRRSPGFRHIESQIEARLAAVEDIATLSRDTLVVAAAVARRSLWRAVAEVKAWRAGLDISAYQPKPIEPVLIRRPGFIFAVYSFDNPDWGAWLFGKFEDPNWESFLFGRLVEDERLSA